MAENKKYYDSHAAAQIIGNLLKKPDFLSQSETYHLSPNDFLDENHSTLFKIISNVYFKGAKVIRAIDLEEEIKDRPQYKAIYETMKKKDLVNSLRESVEPENFDYYYSRLKKMSLLRGYDAIGFDVSYYYDPDSFDFEQKQDKADRLDELSLSEIAEQVECKIEDIKKERVYGSIQDSVQLGASIFDTLGELEETPEMGSPLYGKYINTITRGMRLGKLFIRSAATGVGKTRTMIADACYTACEKMWEDGEWKNIGEGLSCLYISTELDLQEVQTMALSFISGVNEECILKNEYSFDDKSRVLEAAKILEKAPLFIEIRSDFNLRDIEDTIKRNIRINKTQYIFYDYLHSSMKILEEISRRSGGTKLREDNILYLLSVKLKDICTQYGVFILTSTQLNGDWKKEPIPDQNMLRGAKSIADKCDFGCILLDTTEEDAESLSPITQRLGCSAPNIKMSVYKNRRGRYNKFYLWMNADKGTCRFKPIFATDYGYNQIAIEDTQVYITGGDNIVL